MPLALTGREDFRVSPSDDTPSQWVVGNRVTPGWFETVRIPILAGRDFTWNDRAGTPHVAIVNDTLSRQLWNGRAVGQRLRYGQRTLEIVGVVRDSKYATIGEDDRADGLSSIPAGIHVRHDAARADGRHRRHGQR